MSSATRKSDTADGLSIAIIGPDEARRSTIVRALLESQGAVHDTEVSAAKLTVQEFYSYPFELDESPKMLEHRFDAVLVDLDSDPQYALQVVQKLASRSAATVMVYSAEADRDQVIRAMRAGAREFLNLPLGPGDMDGALERIPVREFAMQPSAPATTGLFVFLGAKGGCGVTTVAAGFAVALAQDSGQTTLLIDLGAPLGDAAIQLGMLCDYSIANALQNTTRLDESFLRSLLARHESGLSLLAAPGDFPCTGASLQAIDKLLAVSRQAFQNVVVDIGSRIDLIDSALFQEAANLYLVTEVGLSELRNANRMLTQLFSSRWQRPQVVLNRYTSRALGFDDENVAKALTRTPQWKIPDEDGNNVRNRHTLAELSLEDSAASRAIRQMARAACGLATLPEKKKSFGLFGQGKNIQSRSSTRTTNAEDFAHLSLRIRA
jgi:pilus assembly protein CpaE